MTGPVAPGLAVTLYPGDSARDLEGARVLLLEAQPPIVQLHTVPGPKSAKVADDVRRLIPGVRIWFGIPGNGLVKDAGPAAARVMTARARDLGAELLMFNGEAPSKKGLPGWTPATTPSLTTAQLADRMRAVLDAMERERGSMVLGFTSHDRPDYHHLPWWAVLGPQSPVRLHATQQYASPAREDDEPALPAPTTWQGARARADRSDAEWLKLVRAGTIRADLAPGGGGFATYGQTHDIVAAGVMLIADRTDVSCVWAVNAATGEPDRRKRPKCDEAGARAIRALMRVRRFAGEGAGSIARFQAAKGLTTDGVCGRKTFAALGVA